MHTVKGTQFQLSHKRTRLENLYLTNSYGHIVDTLTILQKPFIWWGPVERAALVSCAYCLVLSSQITNTIFFLFARVTSPH